MLGFTEYFRILTYVVPFFSAATCALLITFSLRDHSIGQENGIKRVTIIYFSLAAFSWFASFLYFYLPGYFVAVNSLTCVAFLLTQVLLYRIYFILTQVDRHEKFSLLHFVFPAAVGGVMFLWSVNIPNEVRLEIVVNRGVAMPAGYELFGRFYSSKPFMRLATAVFYLILTFRRLLKYRRYLQTTANLVRLSGRWLLILCLIAGTSIISPLISSLIPRRALSENPDIIVFASAAIVIQHMLLTCLIIKREYLFYMVRPMTAPSRSSRSAANTSVAGPKIAVRGRHPVKAVKSANGQLDRKRFENYFRKYKPYTDPDLLLTDLQEIFDVNRTYISQFINTTYGVNFNRLINRCRLEELQRLTTTSPAGSDLNVLLTRAGFSNRRQYLRARKIEEGSTHFPSGK